MQIPLESAETLAAIVDEGSMDAAARRLRVTPSAVSQRVKTLEETLGRVLLVRAKPARATSAGAVVVRLARQMALVQHEATVELGAEEADVRVSVAIAVNADSLATWFLRPLARVAEVHPVVFDLQRDDQDHTATLLESGVVLAAVTSAANAVSGCRVDPLGALRYLPVATPAFASRWGLADAGGLGTAPVVQYDRRDDLQNRWLRAVRVDPGAVPAHYVPSSGEFATAIRLGLGWGMLPESQALPAIRSGELEKLDGPPVDVPLYWQQWNLRSTTLDIVAAEVAAEAGRALRRL
ncbi:LysR family transcriptional regulator ArgP [Microbacterium sp. SSW1-59]|uniref:LysR family transcriptional regulator ArgP n=1 Tax=Microbacterium xanthum TaxID=3079794 RepID=UPI002AD53943|nr:LysR family transcriptional regulator ArgP [Microbacterium sp. SSW1-59]MDZ8200080.1 LysR family transcriptional regulator ArgP [Microbacterium sp. SSW1-59]